jgi:hypothetical protein
MFVARVVAKGPWAEEYTVVHLVSLEQIAARSVIDTIKNIIEAVRDSFVYPL